MKKQKETPVERFNQVSHTTQSAHNGTGTPSIKRGSGCNKVTIIAVITGLIASAAIVSIAISVPLVLRSGSTKSSASTGDATTTAELTNTVPGQLSNKESFISLVEKENEICLF